MVSKIKFATLWITACAHAYTPTQIFCPCKGNSKNKSRIEISDFSLRINVMQVSLVINVNVYLLYTSPLVVLIKINQLSQVNMIWYDLLLLSNIIWEYSKEHLVHFNCTSPLFTKFNVTMVAVHLSTTWGRQAPFDICPDYTASKPAGFYQKYVTLKI